MGIGSAHFDLSIVGENRAVATTRFGDAKTAKPKNGETEKRRNRKW
jgi:hypothetical protein